MANGYDDRFCGGYSGCGFSGNSFLIFLLFIMLFSCGGGGGCNCGCGNNCGCNNTCGCLER